MISKDHPSHRKTHCSSAEKVEFHSGIPRCSSTDHSSSVTIRSHRCVPERPASISIMGICPAVCHITSGLDEMKLTGVDLAWQSKGNPTAIASGKLEALVCLYVAGLYAIGHNGQIFGDTIHGYTWVPQGDCR